MNVVIKLSKRKKHLKHTNKSITSHAAATNQTGDPARDLLHVLEQKARHVNGE